MGNYPGSHQKRPFTIQEWRGVWKSGRARYAHLQSAIDVAKHGRPRQIISGGKVVWRNSAAETMLKKALENLA